MLDNNYYRSSFFWSTLSKILKAVLGFISLPLLLQYYGKTDYGILSIAIACNGYMYLLDLGINVGAIKFYSQWKAKKQFGMINKVAHTNISAYCVIACINAIGLLALGFLGERLFRIPYNQFLQLRTCLFILAFFSLFNWMATVFNQLLIADEQIAFTMKIQCIQEFLKMFLIFITLWMKLSLSVYFFFFVLITSLLVIPYIIKCRRENLIDGLRPEFHWLEFKSVLLFSCSIFALSLFQMTATQSRPILLSMFLEKGADAVADFRIIEVVPNFIIMIGGAFSAIFFPKVSAMIANKDFREIKNFAYKWTTLTTILANILCVPFVFSAKEFLVAYVGQEYAGFSIWLILWCITVLIQIHTTPGNALVLAYGKTKTLVIATAFACMLSMIINVMLCKYYRVGSAVIGYFVYVVIVVGFYYMVCYKKKLLLSRIRMLKCFMLPTIISFIALYLAYYICIDFSSFYFLNARVSLIMVCGMKTFVWGGIYLVLLLLFRILPLEFLKRALCANMSRG